MGTIIDPNLCAEWPVKERAVCRVIATLCGRWLRLRLCASVGGGDGNDKRR